MNTGAWGLFTPCRTDPKQIFLRSFSHRSYANLCLILAHLKSFFTPKGGDSSPEGGHPFLSACTMCLFSQWHHASFLQPYDIILSFLCKCNYSLIYCSLVHFWDRRPKAEAVPYSNEHCFLSQHSFWGDSRRLMNGSK